MIKSIRYLIIWLVALVVVSGCDNSLSLPDIFSDLHIEPSIINEGTKVAVTNANIAACQIGVHVTNSDGSALYNNKTEYNNILLKNTGSWIFDNGSGTELRVILYAANAKVYAYYPYPGSISGIGPLCNLSMDVPIENSFASMADYLWASQSTTIPTGGNPINANNPTVTLNLNHAMSQFAFVFYKEGYVGSAILNRITIIDNSSPANLKVNKSGTNDLKMRLSDGLITGGETSFFTNVININSTITLETDPGTEPTVLNNYINGYIFLIPVNIPDRNKLEAVIRIDGVDYTISIPGTGAINLLPGTKYIFKGKLMPRGILAIESVSVTNWSEGGEVMVDSD
ncbi:MAG: fimbrillin family protein [Bacteroidales bacterium]